MPLRPFRTLVGPSTSQQTSERLLPCRDAMQHRKPDPDLLFALLWMDLRDRVRRRPLQRTCYLWRRHWLGERGLDHRHVILPTVKALSGLWTAFGQRKEETHLDIPLVRLWMSKKARE